MDLFKATLNNLVSEKKISTDKVAILVAPALSRKRFKKEQKEINILQKLFIKKKEFVKTQLKKGLDWNLYEQKIALPVLSNLLSIEENTKTKIIPDITFKTFKRIITSGKYEAIFLISHHIYNESEKKSNNLYGKIEFADGGTDLIDIHLFLKNIKSINKISIIYFVCKADNMKEASYNILPSVKSIGYAYWNIPLIEGTTFLKYWILALNNNLTLSESYNYAIKQFININTK